MQKYYLTRHEREISNLLSQHLPGSPFNLSPARVIVPKDLQDLERYPKSFTYHNGEVESFWRPTNWVRPANISEYPVSMRNFTFTKYDVRKISCYIMYWVLSDEGQIFTPLYKLDSKRNIHGEKYVDITRSTSYPRRYESWLDLAEKSCHNEDDSRMLRYFLLNFNQDMYASLERSSDIHSTPYRRVRQRGNDPVQALPESLSFLFQLHLFLAMIFNIGKVDDNVRVRTDIWKPIPYPEEDFQLFFYNKYRLSYLKERRTWRLWEI